MMKKYLMTSFPILRIVGPRSLVTDPRICGSLLLHLRNGRFLGIVFNYLADLNSRVPDRRVLDERHC